MVLLLLNRPCDIVIADHHRANHRRRASVRRHRRRANVHRRHH
jgi:hypothetical protein